MQRGGGGGVSLAPTETYGTIRDHFFFEADGVGCVYMVKTYYIPDPLGPA